MNLKFFDWEWNNNFCVFSSKEYLESQSDEFGWIGGYIDNNLVFVIPFVKKTKFFIKYIYFTTDLISISSSVNPGLFYDALFEFLKNNKISFIAQPPPHAFSISSPKKTIVAPFGTYRVNLTFSEMILWNNLHYKHRNVIRNAMKNDVTIEINSQDYEVIYKLMLDTFNRSNISFLSKTDFLKYMHKMYNKQISFICYYKGVPQGCAIIPFSHHSAYYSYGGSIRNPFTGSINYMHWEAIKFFKSKGVRYYDFVGARINPIKNSKQEGLQRFKSRFGGDLVTGFLWKKPISKFQYYIYRFMVQFKKRNFNIDIIDQELKR